MWRTIECHITDKLIEEQLARLGGVPNAAATAAMLLIRLATLWFAVLVGFAALALLRWRHPGFKLDSVEVRGGAEGEPQTAAENEEP